MSVRITAQNLKFNQPQTEQTDPHETLCELPTPQTFQKVSSRFLCYPNVWERQVLLLYGCEIQIASPSQAGSCYLRNRSLYLEEREALVNLEIDSKAEPNHHASRCKNSSSIPDLIVPLKKAYLIKIFAMLHNLNYAFATAKPRISWRWRDICISGHSFRTSPKALSILWVEAFS